MRLSVLPLTAPLTQVRLVVRGFAVRCAVGGADDVVDVSVLLAPRRHGLEMAGFSVWLEALTGSQAWSMESMAAAVCAAIDSAVRPRFVAVTVHRWRTSDPVDLVDLTVRAQRCAWWRIR